jgi:hypothetical protein
VETENAYQYYFNLTTSTIYSMLVLIVKGTRHVHTKYSNERNVRVPRYVI